MSWLGVLARGRVPKGWPGGGVGKVAGARSRFSLVADRSSPRPARYQDLFRVPLGYRAVR